MSVVAERIHRETGIPYVVMPHGSAIEYAVKKDKRMWNFALNGLNHASKIIVISPEIRTRLQNVFPDQKQLDDKIIEVPLGVDTSLFKTAEDRDYELKKLSSYIETLPPGEGKTQSMTQKLVSDFSFETGLENHTQYNLKSRDQDLQQKISQIQFPLMIFIGRLIAEKGLHTLLFALPELQKRRPDLNLAVVGHGPLREICELLLDALSKGDGNKIEKLVKWADLTEARHFISHLKEQMKWNAYLETAKTHLNTKNVHFLGYLKHPELSPLLSCSDIACFPSMVPEAGPLVFLEAMASGCFPMGTYVAGLKASIDRLEDVLPSHDLDLMKLDPNPSNVIQSLISQIPKALEISGKHRAILRKTAITQFDWKIIVQKLKESFN
jgi:glycosyltransferase involved in cell wall biosynthesis